MGKRKASQPAGQVLELERDWRTVRHVRRQRALFIPRFVRIESDDQQLAGMGQDRAYEIAVQWAELESQGHLNPARETSIDTQFLDQIFAEGLGYKTRTISPTAWQLEHKFSVPSIGQADGAIGDFPNSAPTAVIELKDVTTDLDRDRVNGRTAVQQCWDYLNALPDCPWGIVSNFSTVRLYHRDKGSLAYEVYSLQELRDRKKFNDFYCIFSRDGLLTSRFGQPPKALKLLQLTAERQKKVGNDLYRLYHLYRLSLISHLHKVRIMPFDDSIRIAQTLLDRIIFIAFCEDRDLMTAKCLERAWRELPPFTKVTNPRWQSFLALFGQVDRGGQSAGIEHGYNGNLFKPDPQIDDLELDDEWTNDFKAIGDFDFSEEVSVEVLGHLFERSVTELEKLRIGGPFALEAAAEREQAETNGNGNGNGRRTRRKSNRTPANKNNPLSKMPKSAQRKRFGIYYTPPTFTGLIVERTVDVVVRERFAALQQQFDVDPASRGPQDPKKLRDYWLACLETLKNITVCDPACGSGAFLICAYDAMDAHYKSVADGLAGTSLPKEELFKLEESIPDLILRHNLYGVDLSLEAVEITQLSLWIRSARRNRKLSDLSQNIVRGNSLVSDPSVDDNALDWHKKFPQIFGPCGPGGFTCVIGNPPWERMKLQEREFFSLTDPQTAQAVSAADRRKRIAAMQENNAELHTSYLDAQGKAEKALTYARGCGRFPLTGKGDVNTYMLFAELAGSLVEPQGLVGVLVPSGIATDDTTKEFFQQIMDEQRLVVLYDFENKKGHFEDVHRAFKFTSLVFGGKDRMTKQADFVFFAHDVDEVAEGNTKRHIKLSVADLKLLNPNTRTCPVFRTRRDAELTKAIYKRVPILMDENRRQGRNPWGIKFLRMFDQTNDAELFLEGKTWGKKGYKLQGNVYVKKKQRALPLYEAKMVQAYDHRAASVIVEGENWVRQGQKEETSLVQHQNPEFSVLPRWWVDESCCHNAIDHIPNANVCFLGFKDITSPTNERTMIAAFIPAVAVTNKFPLMFVNADKRHQTCLLANLNSFAFDYVTRQKIGGITLNFFIVEQLPTFPPDHYAEKCPWAKRGTLVQWISERVLKLTCTAEDMIPLAKACGFKGSRGDGVHIWKEQERAEIRAELDAAYFHLYGIERDDVEYILTTFSNTGLLPEDQRRGQQHLWSPGGTGRLILEKYDELAGR
jgi:hypothetical protein